VGVAELWGGSVVAPPPPHVAVGFGP
jgi:hypothetical protein